MSCKGACLASIGADQPAEVVNDAPNHLVRVLVVFIKFSEVVWNSICISPVKAGQCTDETYFHNKRGPGIIESLKPLQYYSPIKPNSHAHSHTYTLLQLEYIARKVIFPFGNWHYHVEIGYAQNAYSTNVILLYCKMDVNAGFQSLTGVPHRSHAGLLVPACN